MAANLWVYKCNRNSQDFATAKGDWDEVFQKTGPTKWGGSWCTSNPVSKHILNEEMAAGDLILAYQTDDRQIVGVCRVHRIEGERNERNLWLKPIHRFVPTVSVHELKATNSALRRVAAFSRAFPQMIYAVSREERKTLERVCGLNLCLAASEPLLPPRTFARGAGVGDPETNRKVERAAVQTVTRWYRSRGWNVESVEASKCGYDLCCERRGELEHVEVKGVAGSKPHFIITDGERLQARSNAAFVICIVTSALSKAPKTLRLTGAELCDGFDLRPLRYHATPKP